MPIFLDTIENIHLGFSGSKEFGLLPVHKGYQLIKGRLLPAQKGYIWEETFIRNLVGI